MATAPKTAGFVTSGLQSPYAAEQANLGLEQQMLLQALQGQQDVSVPTRQTGAVNVLNFDGVGNAIAGQRTQQELEVNRKKQLDVAGKYSEQLVQEMKRFRTADPDKPQELAPFLDSPYPEIRSRAEDEMKSARERLGKALEKADPTTWKNGGMQGIGGFAPKPEQTVVDGTLINTTPGQLIAPVAGGGYKQSTMPDGDVMNTNLLTGRQTTANNAPKTSVSFAQVGPGLVNEKVKLLGAEQASARSKANTLRSTEHSLDALDKGARAGYGEEWLQNARTLVGGMTGLKFDATTPTAILAKSLAENVVNEFGGKLGSGVSNADVQFMQLASAGQATDPIAIERILAIRAAAAVRDIRQHMLQVETLGNHPKNELGAADTQKLYGVAMPNYGFRFKTPEAQASFEAGISDRPYEDVFQEITKGKNPTATPKTASPAKETPAQKTARLAKELGFVK